MKNVAKMLGLLFILLLCTVLLSGVNAQDDMFSLEIELEDLAVGDYLEWSMEMSEDDMDMSGYIRMEIAGTDDEKTVNGTQYSVVTLNVYGEGTVIYQYGIEGDWTMSGAMYYDLATEELVENTITTEITITYLGETIIASNEVTIIPLEESSTLPKGTNPSVGDNWTVTKIEEKTETETMVYPDGEEESTTETTIETTVTEYEYIRDERVTAPAGSFETAVIYQMDIDDEEGEYTIGFRDKLVGLEVKYEYYDNNDDLTGEVELTAYSFEVLQKSGGESVLGPIGGTPDSEDKGLLGLGKIGGIDTFLLLVLTLLIIIIIVVAVSVRKREKTEPIEESQPLQQQYAPQPRFSQQRPVTYPLCPSCGQPLRYVADYQRWYCYSCNRYA